MQVNYAPFIDRVIQRYEGGYGWDRKDPGGPTKYGITCYDYAEFRGRKMDSMSAWAPLVKTMTLAEAETIYKNKYAKAVRFDDLPAGIDCAMLDYGINSGPARPIRVARVILGLPAGGMDLALYDALKKTDPTKFVHSLNGERLRFMHALRTWPTFGRGWQARVDDLTTYCDHVIMGATGGAPSISVPRAAKATHVANTARSTSGVGIVGSAAAAHVAGFDWRIVAALAVVGVVGSVGYEIWQTHRANAANNMVRI